jgi:hypothetical protein
MNSKHLASLLLFLTIVLLFVGVQTLHKKRQNAQDAADAAQAKHGTATAMRSSAQGVLAKTRESTAPLRKYYRMWLPEFEKTDSEFKAKNGFQQTIKRFPTLVMFDQGMNPLAPNKDAAYVTQRASGRAEFQGEYPKAIQFLATLEREIPTSRIASVEIRKGDRANDVKVTLQAEFPIIASGTAAATSKK